MLRRRLECDLWNGISNSTSTAQVNNEIKKFYSQYKRKYNKLHRKNLIEDIILMSLDKGNPSCAKTLMFMDGINLHYKEGAMMNIILHRGYIYLCELLILKDKTLSNQLKTNKPLFTHVLKYGTFDEILMMYPKFGYEEGELIDVLDINMNNMNIDLYERLAEHFGFNMSYRMDFGRSQVLDLSKFRKNNKKRIDTPAKQSRTTSAFVRSASNSTVFEGLVNKYLPSKMIDNRDFIKYKKPPLAPKHAQRPTTSHGKL